MNDIIAIGGIICAVTVVGTLLIGVATAKPKADSNRLATAVKLYKASVSAASLGLLLELFDWGWFSAIDLLTVVATSATLYPTSKRLESTRAAERVAAQRVAEEHDLPWVGDTR